MSLKNYTSRLIAAICLVVLTAMLSGVYASENYEVMIKTEQDWMNLQQHIASDKNTEGFVVKLENDLVINKNVETVGVFKGELIGNGHTITTNKNLFDTLSKTAIVGDLTVKGEISASKTIGGIASVNYGTVQNCFNYAEINAISSTPAGGLVGTNYGNIKESANYGVVRGFSSIGAVGGIAGRNESGVISSCYNLGDITGECAGGILGTLSDGWVASCYNRGKIEATRLYACGIVGMHYRNNSIINCYNVGELKLGSGCGSVAKLGGITWFGSYNNSYYLEGDGEYFGLDNEMSEDTMKKEGIIEKLNSLIITQKYKTSNYFNKVVEELSLSEFIKDSEGINEGYPILWWQEGLVGENEGNFVDTLGHWAYADIEKIKQLGIMEGIGNGYFEPDREITRAEFSKVIVGFIGLKQEKNTQSFKDVTKDNIFHGYIESAYKESIVKGVGEHLFEPNKSITKTEAIAIIVRAIKYKGNDIEIDNGTARRLIGNHIDGELVPSWAIEEVGWSIQEGLLNDKNGYLVPGKMVTSKDMTRGETANIIVNSLRFMGVTED